MALLLLCFVFYVLFIGTSSMEVTEMPVSRPKGSLLQSNIGTKVIFQLKDAPADGSYVIVPLRAGLPPCSGGHEHFTWDATTETHTTKPVVRNYMAHYTVCSLTGLGTWSPVAEVAPHYINPHTLPPFLLGTFLFVYFCIVLGVPKGSLPILLAATLVTRILMHFDLCYNDKEMLGWIAAIMVALPLAVEFPFEFLGAFPVVIAGINWVAQLSTGEDLLRMDCFQAQPVDFVWDWLQGFVLYFSIPWLAKAALAHFLPSDMGQLIALSFAALLLLLNWNGLHYYALASAALAVSLASYQQQIPAEPEPKVMVIKQEAVPQGHPMTTRSKVRTPSTSPVSVSSPRRSRSHPSPRLTPASLAALSSPHQSTLGCHSEMGSVAADYDDGHLSGEGSTMLLESPRQSMKKRKAMTDLLWPPNKRSTACQTDTTMSVACQTDAGSRSSSPVESLSAEFFTPPARKAAKAKASPSKRSSSSPAATNQKKARK